MNPEEDAFGQEMLAYWRGDPVVEVIERDDGYVDTTPGPAIYFASMEDWLPGEAEAIRYAKGRVLDIGCGAGRHALYLQDRGQEVVATDNSPLAIQVCRERGVKDARVMGITALDRSLGQFDSIIMLGNNFGLFASFKRARWLLRRFRNLTTGDGRIIAASSNVYATDNPAHLAYHERNRQRGRMSGQLRLRVRFRQYKSPWFDYLIVSPDEMKTIAEGTGWQIAEFLGDVYGRYTAIMEKV
jgi:SAM-dependent methyltransferase